jgi:L-alanine-DL-glutamate epimerase-like enolase superfamily enzyme
MMLSSIGAASLAIPFKHAFKHAAAERAVTETVWIEARGQDGHTGFGEGCPRVYVTGESLQTAAEFVRAHRPGWVGNITGIDTLFDWVARHPTQIDWNPAAWAAVELALLDLIGNTEQRSVESLLGLPELSGSYRYTAVLGDAPPKQFEAQLAAYVRMGFRDFKIKLAGDRARDRIKLDALGAMRIPARAVRADANGVWSDSTTALRHLGALRFPFFAVEEPLRAGDYRGMLRISSELDTHIILDESLLRVDQLGRLADCSDRWIVNLRVSKSGGLLRSLELVSRLRRLGWRAVCGAHVGETSLLARASLIIAQSARDLLVGQEGAFGTNLLEVDVTGTPIMFGPGGVLQVDTLGIGPSGLGLAISRPTPNSRSLARTGLVSGS